MFQGIINVLKEFFLFVGYVKSNNFKLALTDEESEKLFKMLKTNKKDEAREKLITHNLRLIAHIVKKYDNCGVHH